MGSIRLVFPYRASPQRRRARARGQTESKSEAALFLGATRSLRAAICMRKRAAHLVHNTSGTGCSASPWRSRRRRPRHRQVAAASGRVRKAGRRRDDATFSLSGSRVASPDHDGGTDDRHTGKSLANSFFSSPATADIRRGGSGIGANAGHVDEPPDAHFSRKPGDPCCGLDVNGMEGPWPRSAHWLTAFTTPTTAGATERSS
jgi:hypothetical protein